MVHVRNPGIVAALFAALLFGISTPLAKLLLVEIHPWLLAGLLYLGSGIGIFIVRRARRASKVELTTGEAGWLLGAIAAGGVAAPVLLMWSLANMAASEASLLLNAEGVFTALLAWYVFRENFDARIAFGLALMVAGAIVLSWPANAQFATVLPALGVLSACFAWAVDNNLTRKVSLADATFIAMAKGLVAGIVNLTLGLLAGATIPAAIVVLSAALLGFVSYGVSLTLFVVALRHLGTARAAAYFSTAPFAGAVFALMLLHETLTLSLVIAGLLMGVGVWVHLTERHEHVHAHEPLEHEHEHEHDEHHQHDHPDPVAAGTRHSHWHRHQALTHIHPHFPDAHHRHTH